MYVDNTMSKSQTYSIKHGGVHVALSVVYVTDGLIYNYDRTESVMSSGNFIYLIIYYTLYLNVTR